tara:strand:- start:140 stop:373 length:234 start_codon:yes stop_codon:yes gene_type:complete
MPPKKIKFNVKKKAPAPVKKKKFNVKKKAPVKKGLSDEAFKKLVADSNRLMEEADLHSKEMKADIAEIKRKIKNFKR